MFSKVLIANRGEIACRIIRTCRKMGVKTVAVYSEADRDALHVRMADESRLLGPAPPLESYLDMDKILAAARDSGAEAIHPCYGFLSENPVFAWRCQEAGITFIGPDPSVMEAMGDKLRARRLAGKAGLPVLPGTDGPVADSEAIDKAWELGFPLMVKATEGGGGIGIHVIESMDELMPLVERTRKVAASAFGSSRLFFERYLKDASHIEVQLIGDQHGNLVHLYERDCSMQRRNQKLVEETPAVKLDPSVRDYICEMALKLGRHIGYTNAGTAEFLVSPKGKVYFLELNTRLQVEHGVTELVTGVDLVELQFRVAAGEPLPIGQDDVRPSGHAIEARIYPEDPRTLLPAIGVVNGLRLPEGPGMRVDSALCNGYEVTLHYEPLLAKVMAWAPERSQALQNLDQALRDTVIQGVKTNIPLQRDILANPEFTAATHHTGTLSALASAGQQPGTQDKHSMNGNGHHPDDRRTTAAIGVALALALGESQPAPVAPNARWKALARQEQFVSRTIGSLGWR